MLKHDENKQTCQATITATVAHKEFQPNMHHPGPWRPNQSQQRRNYSSGQWKASSASNSAPQWRANFQQNADSGRYNNRTKCQLCDKPGHTAKVCRSKSHDHIEAKANYVSSL